MLQLHVPTLLTVTLLINLLLACFCLSSWFGRGDRQIYIWISLAEGGGAIGCALVMLRLQIPDWASIWLSQTVILVSNGLLWAGVRVFEKRTAPIAVILGGAGAWTAFSLTPQLYNDQSTRVTIVSLLILLYFIAIIIDLLRGYRADRSNGRIIALTVASIHAIACIARISLSHSTSILWPLDTGSNWTGAFVIETLVNSVVIVLALTTMERDRAEREQHSVATTDVLTGALTRRAFLDEATDWIERQGKDAALLLFDLDHFKKINDTYGHAAGDAALITFAKLTSRRIDVANIIAGFNLDASTSGQYPRWYETTLADAIIGGKPLFGRLGGEEFACLLPHLSLKQGVAIANDIRSELEDLEIVSFGRRIQMSVSASVVTTADIGHRLDIMLSSADQALYQAKNKGRNRVEAVKSEQTTLRSRSTSSVAAATDVTPDSTNGKSFKATARR